MVGQRERVRELREINDKDIAGMRVFTSEGEVLGRVRKEISEVALYTMRYLVVEVERKLDAGSDAGEARQQEGNTEGGGSLLAIPMTAVSAITPEGVFLELDAAALSFLPPYRVLNPAFEKEVHLALARVPYWKEE